MEHKGSVVHGQIPQGCHTNDTSFVAMPFDIDKERHFELTDAIIEQKQHRFGGFVDCPHSVFLTRDIPHVGMSDINDPMYAYIAVGEG